MTQQGKISSYEDRSIESNETSLDEDALKNLDESGVRRVIHLFKDLVSLLTDKYHRELSYTEEIANLKSELKIKGQKLKAANKKIKKRDKKIKKSEELSYIDELTCIPNRRSYNKDILEEIERVKRNGQDLSLIVIDIDLFKLVNDEYGHSMGDLVLKLFADLLSSKTRNVDKLYRRGGEEFVLLLPNTNIEGAKNIAEKLRARVEKEDFNVGKNICNFTISLGICGYKKRDTADMLFDRADEAASYAKNQGRNMVISYKDNVDEIKDLIKQKK